MIAVLLISGLTFSQIAPPPTRIPDETAKVEKTVVKTENTKSNWGEYVAFSVSTANRTQPPLSTLQSTYYTLEGGMTYKNISMGVGVGRTLQASYSSDLKDNDHPEYGFNIDPTSTSYFIEPRFVWNVLDFTVFKAGLIGGFGTYLARAKPFILEYGIGTELDSKYLNYTIQFTNWGSASYGSSNYFSVGISKNF